MTARLVSALRAAAEQSRRRMVSLDAPGLHATIPDPATVGEGDDEESADEDPPHAADVIAGSLRLLDAQERVRDTGAAHAEAQAALVREEESQREYLSAYDVTAFVQRLGELTPRQRQIIEVRLDILVEGDTPTHHEVGRRLGITAGTVSKLWARLTAKAHGVAA